MRKVLILPQNNIDEESMAKLETSLQGGTVVELEGLGSAMLLIDGERLDIVDLIDRLWNPTAERNQLAERLRSRTDIDWLKIDQE